MNTNNHFDRKIRVTGNLVFDTAFHIGSGREGELATDMGVLLDPEGDPVLPGSSLKGNLRSLAERLAPYLSRKSAEGQIALTACLLDSDLSGIDCVGDEAYRRGVHDKFMARTSEKEKIEWLKRHTCDVCRLFGSPYQASRIFFADGILKDWSRGLQVRDGVCIDRDTETARHGFKYDFEVVPKGAIFEIGIDIENPDDTELALVGAALAEWENGFRIGGFTSRGLGAAKLVEKKVMALDYANGKSLAAYLLKKQMTEAEGLFENLLEDALTA